jgi:hypothetical protein
MMRAFDKMSGERARSGEHSTLRSDASNSRACPDFSTSPSPMSSRAVRPIQCDSSIAQSGTSYKSGFAHVPCDWDDDQIFNLFLAKVASGLPQLHNAAPTIQVQQWACSASVVDRPRIGDERPLTSTLSLSAGRSRRVRLFNQARHVLQLLIRSEPVTSLTVCRLIDADLHAVLRIVAFGLDLPARFVPASPHRHWAPDRFPRCDRPVCGFELRVRCSYALLLRESTRQFAVHGAGRENRHRR